MAAKRNTSISKHDLVPVPLAARIVYERAYGAPPPVAHLDHRLDGLAYRLASVGPLYAALEEPRRLSRQEIATGLFRKGGKEFHFLDERAPILHLGVTQECIERTAAALRAEKS
jgi:hypothetical protein